MKNQKVKAETADLSLCGDSVLTGINSDPLYRYEDMLTRRRLAALAGQHRTVQRYTKKIAIFRAAFGIPQEDDEPKRADGFHVADHKIARNPRQPSSMYDVAGCNTRWVRGQTARGLKEVGELMERAGYMYSRKTADGLTRWKFFRGDKSVELHTIGGSMWCAAAYVDGKRLPLFDFRADAQDDVTRGIPMEIASDDWNGLLSASDAQKYSVSWVRLVQTLKSRS